jgi:hypothetical protein
MISCDKTGKLLSLLNFKDWRSRGKKKKKPRYPIQEIVAKLYQNTKRTLTFFPFKVVTSFYSLLNFKELRIEGKNTLTKSGKKV